jgi:hypothetical protein
MNPQIFETFTERYHQKLSGMSDAEKVRAYIAWCKEKNMEEVILRLSSESKGGWSKNLTLDFTTERIIISRKSFLTKFADFGYVAGLAPYPYLLTMKDNADVLKIRKQADFTPQDLLESENLEHFILYSDILEFTLRKGWETMVANMMGRAILSNFLAIRTAPDDKTYNFTLPVNKNGPYESISFWVGVALPIKIEEK